MENFDLSRLTSLSFERLVRALSFELMGPSGVVYSSGPDGARDYTFDGDIPGYEPRNWSGYLVLQAKFRETPEGGTSDVNWLLKQITRELKKYSDKNVELKRPKYYILATNISLSGSDGKGTGGRKREGGLTKIEKALEGWKSKIGLVDFDIWHGPKIIDLLVGAPSVRQTYAAWITSGDVLSSVLHLIKPKNPDFKDIIVRGLKDSIRRDQHARLRDAGSVIDSQIRVSQVFIDLPANTSTNADFDYFFDEDGHYYPRKSNNGIVAKIVERSKEKLDPDSIYSNLNSIDTPIIKNRIVILGGPGQGKSTASMFVAQLFRAALLSGQKSSAYDENVKSLIPEILGRAADEKISKDIPLRYPVFVSLPRFADAISKAKSIDVTPPSLLSQISSELSLATDSEITRTDLRIWLKSYPWIAIFDGLDEVPPSGERKSVIEAIASFQSEVVLLESDVLIIVTTRPQGYNNDLDENHWDHWQLDDLPAERATAYAEALGNARYPADPYRRSEILTSIKEATTKPTTARLLISPLQVTIMYLIVDTGGSVPAARWSLFNEYFEVLRKREKAKGGINQKILERNSSQLGPIHQRAGLVLQTDSEHEGGATSALDKPRFFTMLQAYLRTSEYDKSEIEYRASELMRVALDRLVLLSAREEGKITFDVRSLQEFMAAAALTSGDHKDVENRLNHIASLSHWRHVFLIAASRCFAEDNLHHLRSMIIGIPRYIDSKVSDFNVRAGANLSLEMFIDGIGTDHPKSRRILAQHALELLSLGPRSLDDRLALLVDEHTVDLVTQVIREKILEINGTSHLSAWKLLLTLCSRNPTRFTPMAEDLWPSDHVEILNIIEVANDPLPTQKLVTAVFDAAIKTKPSVLLAKFGRYFEKIRQARHSNTAINYSTLIKFDFEPENEEEKYYVGLLAPGPLRIRYTPFDCITLKDFSLPMEASTQWSPLIGAAQFVIQPNSENLSKCLVDISKSQALKEAKVLCRLLPWPIAKVIDIATDEADLLALATAAKNGDFGNVDIWKSAQHRWKEFNISKEDLQFDTKDRHFGKSIAKVGMPYLSGYQISHGTPNAVAIATKLNEIAASMIESTMQSKIFELSQFCSLGIDQSERIDEKFLKESLTAIKKYNLRLSLNSLFLRKSSIWADDEIVKLIAESCTRIQVYGVGRIQPNLKLIITALNRNPDCRALLVLVAVAVGFNSSENNFELSEIDEKIFTPKESDSTSIKISLALLNVLKRNDFSSEISSEIFNHVKESEAPIISTDFICKFLEDELIETECAIRYLDQILQNIEDKTGALASRVREALRKKLNSRRSTLTCKGTWIDELNLPDDAFSILQPVNLTTS